MYRIVSIAFVVVDRVGFELLTSQVLGETRKPPFDHRDPILYPSFQSLNFVCVHFSVCGRTAIKNVNICVVAEGHSKKLLLHLKAAPSISQEVSNFSFYKCRVKPILAIFIKKGFKIN